MRTNLVLVLLLAGCSSNGTSDPGPCPAMSKPKSGGTMHDFESEGSTDAVWKAADSPHIVNSVAFDDASLTIEACSYVLMGNEATLSFDRSAKLVAQGTADQPIVFDALDDSMPWNGIQTLYQTQNGQPEDTMGGHVTLAYATLTNGGNHYESFDEGMLDAHGFDVLVDGTPTTEHFDVQHVTIDTSADWGVHMTLGAGFSATSTDLTIKNTTTGTMLLGFRSLGTLPEGSYAQNPNPRITVDNDINAINTDTTIHDRGVPYEFNKDGADWSVGAFEGTTPSTLTIEPGVTLEFPSRANLDIDSNGILVANGTAAKPITFASAAATQAPGDWGGIYFEDVPRTGNSIQNAKVAYAGQVDASGGTVCDTGPGIGSIGGYGAINFRQAPLTELVMNTSIEHSASDGITRGWTGAPLDFEATNTFSNLAKCKQSYPVPTGAAECPTPVPCDAAP